MTNLTPEHPNPIDDLLPVSINPLTLHHWLDCFHYGQILVAVRAGVFPARVNYCLGFINGTTGQLSTALAGYDERQRQITHFLELHELRHLHPIPLMTSASLDRLEIYFPIGDIPLITAAEEQAHAVYHAKIKDRMGLRNRVTHRYDGSDTWENHAVRVILTLGIDQELSFFNQHYDPLPPDELRAIRQTIKLTPRQT
jgi:hypothetical protein